MLYFLKKGTNMFKLISISFLFIISLTVNADVLSKMVHPSLIFKAGQTSSLDLVLNTCEGRNFRNKYSVETVNRLQRELIKVGDKLLKSTGLDEAEKLRLPVGFLVTMHSIYGIKVECGLIDIPASYISRLEYDNQLAFLLAHEFVHYLALHGLKEDYEVDVDTWADVTMKSLGIKNIDHLEKSSLPSDRSIYGRVGEGDIKVAIKACYEFSQNQESNELKDECIYQRDYISYLEKEFHADEWAVELLMDMGYSLKGIEKNMELLTSCPAWAKQLPQDSFVTKMACHGKLDYELDQKEVTKRVDRLNKVVALKKYKSANEPNALNWKFEDFTGFDSDGEAVDGFDHIYYRWFYILKK